MISRMENQMIGHVKRIKDKLKQEQDALIGKQKIKKTKESLNCKDQRVSKQVPKQYLKDQGVSKLQISCE